MYDILEEIIYPEDIWRAARPAAHVNYPSEYQQAMAIAALILAERERCANTAEVGHDNYTIAAAIRRGA